MNKITLISLFHIGSWLISRTIYHTQKPNELISKPALSTLCFQYPLLEITGLLTLCWSRWSQTHSATLCPALEMANLSMYKTAIHINGVTHFFIKICVVVHTSKDKKNIYYRKIYRGKLYLITKIWSTMFMKRNKLVWVIHLNL